MQHPTLSSLTAPQTAYLLSEQQVVYVVVVSTLAAPLQGHTVLAQPWKADKRVLEGPDVATKSLHSTACR